MNAFLLAATAATGVHLLTSEPSPTHRAMWERARRCIQRRRLEVAATGGAALLATALFGAGPVAVALTLLFAATPPWLRRRASERRRNIGQAAWPSMIEELRILTGTLGRSIPQALLEVGRRAPEELRPAFDAAQREWSLTGDFESTTAILTRTLAEPTADAACETLLVAHLVGGNLDQRLADLAADRRRDVLERRAAQSAMAGARLARWFVIVVPLAMLFAGATVGNGVAAYRTPSGAFLLCVAAAMVGACWWWAGALMRVPSERRVLTS
ncbi:MAG: type II secretion system F family protein [Actinomycetes bacterium]